MTRTDDHDHDHGEPYCHVCKFRAWLSEMVAAVRRGDLEEVSRLESCRPLKTPVQGALS